MSYDDGRWTEREKKAPARAGEGGSAGSSAGSRAPLREGLGAQLGASAARHAKCAKCAKCAIAFELIAELRARSSVALVHARRAIEIGDSDFYDAERRSGVHNTLSRLPQR